MLVRKTVDVKQVEVDMEGAEKTYIRVLISEEDGAPNFLMREFEIKQGGETPYHTHDFEHEIYVLSGEGVAVSEEGESPMRPGTVIFVPSYEEHNFKNTGVESLIFLCLIPIVD